MKQKNIEIVQMIRGMACISIFFFHLPDTWDGRAKYSGFPLVIFFILTGFFLIEGTRKDEKNYFIKKIIRIVPLYWSLTILIFLTSFIMPEINNGKSLLFSDLVKSLFFIPYYNLDGKLFPILSVGWTLIIEVYEYIVFWILYKILRNSKYRDFLTVCLFSLLVLIGYLIKWKYKLNSPFIVMWTYKYQWAFVLGLLISCIKKSSTSKNIKIPVIKKNLHIFIIYTGAFYIFCYCVADKFALLYGFIFSFVALFLFVDVHFSKCIVLFGNMSYSFYLLHKFVIAIIEKLENYFRINMYVPYGGVLLSFAVTICLSIISYHIVEKKFCGLLKKYLLNRN